MLDSLITTSIYSPQNNDHYFTKKVIPETERLRVPLCGWDCGNNFQDLD